MTRTLAALAADLAAGRATARGLVEEALAAVANPAGEGARAFISVAADRARLEADAMDAARKAGKAPSALAGIPFGVKDLFDVAGEVTAAGSALLKSAAPATQDSDAVARLRDKGLIPLGRTNMTEFAYSGVGLNPHYGTPLSVYGRTEKRIPGGSSSGTAVAIAEGMVPFGLGTDTGGSCRIPAAFNAITGFKPTASRVSRRGVYPLSGSFDSVGPLGQSVACCAAIDAILADAPPAFRPRPVSAARIAVLSTYVLDGLDGAVSGDFERALSSLAAKGARLEHIAFPALANMPAYLKNGGIVAAEAWAHHAPIIARHEAEYDPRVVSRIRFGAQVTAEELASLTAARAGLVADFGKWVEGFDAVLCPAVPMIPPRLAELAEEGDYRRLNGMALRNTYVFNFLDACAISLPMSRPGSAPTGLMLALPGGRDTDLLALAAGVESALQG